MTPKLTPHGLELAGQTLSATDVAQLIAQLAQARAQMTPSVPMTLAQTPDDTPLTFCTSPSIAMSVTAQSAVRMTLRHDGHGWLSFEFDNSQAAWLRQWFQNRVDERGAGKLKQMLSPDRPH